MSEIEDEYYRIDCELFNRIKHTGNAFFQPFGRFTHIQRKTIPEIIDGKDALIISSTASGKTEAACSPLIEKNYLRKKPWTILYISPTRALVNDLFYRILEPTRKLNIKMVRRTGDHRDSLKNIPQIIITTPESFDSLLCRNRRDDKYGHVLSNVVAIVLDEIHLLHGTPRGEQLKWLINRLRNLRKFAEKKSWSPDSIIQIIGLSATIPDQESILNEYFNKKAIVINYPGQREIETVLTKSDDTNIEDVLLNYINNLNRNEKILVFCNSRRRVDLLTKYFKKYLKKGYEIHAHHGSLSKNERENAEYAIKMRDKILLFATSTLEIGVDIGNIDLIVLDGPPPDLPALLQRIGRGNRRTDKTRVLLCANSIQDYFLQIAMIKACEDGWLGRGRYGHNYTVIRQQIASYIYQSKIKKRSLDGLNKLFNESVIKGEIYDSIIKKMVEDDDLIVMKNDIYKLGDYWWNLAGQMGLIHSNIESGPGLDVVDIESGEKIASGVIYEGGKGVGIGGKNLKVCSWKNMTLDVRKQAKNKPIEGKWRYVTMGCPVYSGQSESLKRYLEIDEYVWPIIRDEAFVYVFHMGGVQIKALIHLLKNEYASTDKTIKTYNEWFIKIRGNYEEKPLWLEDFNQSILKLLLNSNEKILNQTERNLGRPYSNKKLPYNVRVEEVWEWLDVEYESNQIKKSK
ncbi:DEAD/DEAH box helicase, partial [Thermoplasmatota archaeon]